MIGPIKVLIVDDHPVVRGGLIAALGAKADMAVVGEAGNGLDAERLALEARPDVIIMDLRMPGRGGLESMLAIKQRLPDVKVLCLTVSEEDRDLFDAVRLGADGYLLKSTGMDELLGAVRKIAAGDAMLSPNMTARLFKGLRGRSAQPALSPREEEVLTLLEQGLSNSEIGERLFLSANTVNSYIRRLLDKLHLKNRGEAIAYAVRRQK